jgi:HAE1 family hydrophobic/amphiphilic exporter-1
MLAHTLAAILARPVSSLMVLLAVVAVGMVSFRGLPSQLTPEVEYPRLTVALAWRSAPPEAVESTITAPLEGELSKLAGLKTLSSVSSEGRARLTLEFHPSVNIDIARLEINERLSNLMETLPREVSPPSVSPYVPEEVEKMQGFLTYTLSANRSAGEVRRYAEEYLKLPLRSVKGVSDVEVQGGSLRHVSIELDRSSMESMNLRPEDVTAALNDAYLTLSGAKNIRASDKNINPRDSIPALAHTSIVQSFTSIEDLHRLPIAVRIGVGTAPKQASFTKTSSTQNGNNEREQTTVIRLGDIAHIKDDFAAPTSFYRLNGKETVTLRLRKEQGADILQTADRTFEVVQRLEAALPSGYTLIKESDTSEAMRIELADLYTTLGLATLAVALVIIGVFRRESALRMAVIILTSVAVTLCLAAIGFAVCGLGLNIITIAAILLGFGVAVDTNVIMAEYLERYSMKTARRERFAHQRSAHHRFVLHTRTMAVPLLGSALTTVAVILPLLFLETELRAYLSDFALASVIIVCAAVLVALSLVPLLCRYWLPHHAQLTFEQSTFEQSNITLQQNTRAFTLYSWLVRGIARFRKTVIAVLILLAGVPVWLLPPTIDVPYITPAYNAVFDSPLYGYLKPTIQIALGGAWNIFSNRLPRGDMWQVGGEQYLMVVLKLPNGNRIERINTLASNMEQEVLRYGGSIKLLSTSVVSDELAFLRVEFPNTLADRSFPYKLKNYLTAYATRLGGLEVSVFGYGEAFSTGFGGAPVSFAVTAKGFNYDDVKKLAEEFRRVIERNPRVAQVDIDRSAMWGDPEVFENVITLDRERMKRSGATVEQILPLIRMNAIGTLGGNRFRLGNEELSYDVKYAGYENNQARELMGRSLTDARGTQLKIGSVATLSERKALAKIFRENRQYVRTITFEFQGPYRYGEEFLKQSLASVRIRPGYSLESANGRFTFGDEQTIDILGALLLSVLLIFMIGAALFESLRVPVVIICSIPIALMGAVYSLWWADLTIDRGAYAGMLLLIGLAVNIAIVMVYQIVNHVRHTPAGSPPQETLVAVSYQRLRPVIITGCTTVLAMLPLLVQTQHGFWQTLAATVIGGVVWSSVVLVLTVPILLALLSPSIAQSQQELQTTSTNLP